jgi:hypothetical protein
MKCPNCKTDIPHKTDIPQKREAKADKVVRVSDQIDDNRTPAPEDALRADRPPAPCPQCGWSTMWNE